MVGCFGGISFDCRGRLANRYDEAVPKQFSSRTSWDLAQTPYAAAVEAARVEAKATGSELYDLTASNPTTCGFSYDPELVLAPLSEPKALVYQPDAMGLRSAREAVAAYYADHGARVGPEQILLTTSTSEGYSFLFRLLCDPGDEVLAAQPSYPLFDYLADLDNVRLVPYPLFYDHGWHVDLAALEQRITPRTRAILLVHPNNPTGHYTKAAERTEVERICAERGLALIVDEVFLDYAIEEIAIADRASFATGKHRVLTFTLSGMSKIAGLPQMKAAWLIAQGPEDDLAEALARLEVIGDTYLSMNAPVQLALPHWLEGRHPLQQEIRSRVRTNLLQTKNVACSDVNALRVEGGWSLVLRVPATESGEEAALRLLRKHKVLVHPGEFYGMGPGRLVVSLLTPEETYREGLLRVARGFAPHGMQDAKMEPK